MNVNDMAVVVLSRSDWEIVKLALSEWDATLVGQDRECRRIIDYIRFQTRREIPA